MVPTVGDGFYEPRRVVNALHGFHTLREQQDATCMMCHMHNVQVSGRSMDIGNLEDDEDDCGINKDLTAMVESDVLSWMDKTDVEGDYEDRSPHDY